jgi:hypothetical protein
VEKIIRKDYMKQTIYYLLFSLIFISCVQKKSKVDHLVLDRIEYVYHLKSFVDEDVWTNFNDTKFDIPLVYYTDTECYVANPTEKFIKKYQPELVFESNIVKIYRTVLLDSIPFHMSVGMSLDDSTAYNYKSPFMYCSSVEMSLEEILSHMASHQ